MFRSWWDHQTTFVPNGTPDAFPSRSALGRASGRISLSNNRQTPWRRRCRWRRARFGGTMARQNAFSEISRPACARDADTAGPAVYPRPLTRMTRMTRNGLPVPRDPEGPSGSGPRRAQGSNRRSAAVSQPDPRPGNRPIPRSGRAGPSGGATRIAIRRAGGAGGSTSRHTFAPEAGSQWCRNVWHS